MSKLIKHIIVWAFTRKKRKSFIKKIDKIYHHIKSTREINVSQLLIREHKKLWNELSKKSSSKWIKVYMSVNNIQDINYIPETIYYTIVEPTLNNRQLTKGYADKNFYDLYYEKGLFPKVILRNIDGIYYNASYEKINMDENKFKSILSDYEKAIVKPTIDSGGGHSVSLIKTKEDEISLNKINQKYQRNYIIQNYIYQHQFFKQFNPTSVNTVRIFTYKSVINDEIIPIQSVLRVGKEGSIVDNQASGGVSIGINQDGILNRFAVDKYGNLFDKINSIDLNELIKVPKYNQMVSMSITIAQKNYYSRLIGFDFCLDEKSNIKIIEINNVNNEINFFQMNNGPLFGQYTNEVIDYCLNNPRTFAFDFTI